MSNVTNDLLKAVLQLGVRERTEFMERIQESLKSKDHEDCEVLSDEEFIAEINRRRDEARRDPSVMIPYEQIRKTR